MAATAAQNKAVFLSGFILALVPGGLIKYILVIIGKWRRQSKRKFCFQVAANQNKRLLLGR